MSIYHDLREIGFKLQEKSLNLFTISDNLADGEDQIEVVLLYFEGHTDYGNQNNDGSPGETWHDGEAEYRLRCTPEVLRRTAKKLGSMPRLSLTRLVKDGKFKSREEAADHIDKYGNFGGPIPPRNPWEDGEWDSGYWDSWQYQFEFFEWFASLGWDVFERGDKLTFDNKELKEVQP